jgi:hypothetical protein
VVRFSAVLSGRESIRAHFPATLWLANILCRFGDESAFNYPKSSVEDSWIWTFHFFSPCGGSIPQFCHPLAAVARESCPPLAGSKAT